MPDIVGPYELRDQIANDALSRTHRAVRADTGEPVHVRLVRLTELSGALRERFEQLATVAESLSHENILATIEHGLHEGAPYVVLEPIEGNTLRELLAKEPGRRLPPEVVATIGIDIASALVHAHGQTEPVLHRALSPDAIEIDAHGVSRVASFTLPALLVEIAATQTHLLEHVCRYSSPEDAKQQRACSASDVFALGATLYEALAGKPAFDAPTPLATVLKVTMGTHVSLDLVAPTAPSRLRALVTRMLSRNEADRPSARDVQVALEEVAGRDRSRRAAVAKRAGASGASMTTSGSTTLPSAVDPLPRTSGASPLAPSSPASDSPWPASPPAARASAPTPVPSAPAPVPSAPAPVPSPPAPSPSPPASALSEPASVDDAGAPMDDLPTEQTRIDGLPAGPAPPPPPVREPPSAVRPNEPPPVRVPPAPQLVEPDLADLPGEPTSWDTRVPDAPIDATAPDIDLPPDRDEAATRPLVVEKTVQIAMPASAGLFAEGRPTLPVEASAAAKASAAPHQRRATKPMDPASLSAASDARAGEYQSPYGGSSVWLFVAIGVGAIAAVALVAVMAVWLAQ